MVFRLNQCSFEWRLCAEDNKNFHPKRDQISILKRYGIPAQGSLAITFQIKACNDAYLVVRIPETVSIQIILGGWDNTRSCIRILGTSGCLSTSIGGVLNCYQYRSFTVDWKGWEGRQITVSLGNTTSENPKTILSISLSFRIFDVSIGISTGYGSSGQWLLQGINTFFKSQLKLNGGGATVGYSVRLTSGRLGVRISAATDLSR